MPRATATVWQVRHPRSGYAAELALVVALYYVAAHVGYALQFAGPVASVVWLPVGVGIAVLYLRGLWLWPAIVIGDLLVNNYSAVPVGSAVGQTFGNLLEVVIAAVLLRRLAARDAPLATRSSLAGVLVAIAVATAVSATIGSLSLWAGAVIDLGSLAHVWQTWWLGDFCGAMIVLPLALAWFPPPPRGWVLNHALETIIVLATVAVLSYIALHGGHHLSYLAFPVLVWAAVRLGPRGATLALTVSAGMMIWGTTHYLGPFAVHSINSSLLDIQLYLAITAISALALAALAAERETLAATLRASRNRIVVAADAERRRVERDLHDGAQGRLVALAARLTLAAREARTLPASAGASLESAHAEVLTAIDELRDLVHGIHPAALRRFGLARAVEELAALSATPIEVIELPEARLDETAEATSYYVVFEAVANAHRYAHASKVTVWAHLEGGTLTVEVQDDGVGGAVEVGERGLQGLRDRVEATGGTFFVESLADRGTRVSAEIPATLARA
ncbi:MAG: MASE1 domain-containing protein [Solirubrobacterales bacterium]|nr:MASE1 domain-containing protein [Solirubrobacterales bacterium]